MYPWKKGMSLSFFKNERGEAIGAETEILRKVSSRGFACVELSFSHEDYFERYHLNEGETARRLQEYCGTLGMRIWSIHLPFSERWDLSGESAAEALRDDEALLRAAGSAGISVAVIHPSFEPIADEDRSRRLRTAKENLRRLNETARECGVTLGLENLPRTCLGNRSEEMAELLEETGASFVFDTNHSLAEDNVAFLRAMLARGHCPVSLHVSDYDFVDERHDLPGRGINRWRELLDLLLTAGYAGPLLYEIRPVIAPGCTVAFEEVAENIELLLQGKIGGR